MAGRAISEQDLGHGGVRRGRLAAPAFLCVALLAAGPGQTVAAARVLLMADPLAQGAPPYGDPVHRIAVQHLGARLRDGGFAVVEQTTGAEGSAPVDVAALFAIHVLVRNHGYTTKVETRMTGRLLNLGNGQEIGSFALSAPRALRAAGDCARACVEELAGRSVQALSRELGARMTERLAAATGHSGLAGPDPSGGSGLPTAYTLVFDGFSPEAVLEFEEYLVAFSGYGTHRPLSAAPSRQVFWYETRSGRGRLNRNLGKMLAHLQLRGAVSLDGNTFTLRRGAESEANEPSWDDW